jgi:hypothetical protein
VKSRPTNGLDSEGLLKIPIPIPIRTPRLLKTCCQISDILRVVRIIREIEKIYKSISIAGNIEGGNPWKHCLWSCKATKERGADFAKEMALSPL